MCAFLTKKLWGNNLKQHENRSLNVFYKIIKVQALTHFRLNSSIRDIYCLALAIGLDVFSFAKLIRCHWDLNFCNWSCIFFCGKNKKSINSYCVQVYQHYVLQSGNKQYFKKNKIKIPFLAILNDSMSTDLNWILYLLKGFHCIPQIFFFPTQRFKEHLTLLQSPASIWTHYSHLPAKCAGYSQVLQASFTFLFHLSFSYYQKTIGPDFIWIYTNSVVESQIESHSHYFSIAFIWTKVTQTGMEF